MNDEGTIRWLIISRNSKNALINCEHRKFYHAMFNFRVLEHILTKIFAGFEAFFYSNKKSRKVFCLIAFAISSSLCVCVCVCVCVCLCGVCVCLCVCLCCVLCVCVCLCVANFRLMDFYRTVKQNLLKAYVEVIQVILHGIFYVMFANRKLLILLAYRGCSLRNESAFDV